MRRDVQSVLLVLVGGAILRLSVSGAYQSYVKPGLGRWLTVAGAVLLVLGLWSVARELWAGRHTAPMGGPAGGGDAADAHGHGPGWVAWLLLVPVLTIFLVAPPPLGAYAASRSVAVLPPPPPQDLPPLIGDPARLGVVDFAMRAVWDDGRTLRGRDVVMVGFVTRAGAGGWFLTKMQISCCAADAQAYRVRVLDAAGPPADTWVRVTGRWVPGGGTQRDDAIPRLRATSVVTVLRPADPYE